MPPGTPNPTSQYYPPPTLTTIQGPQLTTRYGPQPTVPPPTPNLQVVQGPQLTTRYTLPGMQSSGASTPRPTALPRIPSQTFYHTTTSSPLALPSGPPSATQHPQATSSLLLPTSGAAPNTAAAAAAALTRGGGRKPMTLRGAFSKELHALMYACGDDANPSFDTVNVMEEILIEYIEQLATTALRGQPKPKLTVDGLRRALGRPADKEKLGRLNDLVYRERVIATARRGWKDPY